METAWIGNLSGEHIGFWIRIDDGQEPAKEAISGVLQEVSHRAQGETRLRLRIFSADVELTFASDTGQVASILPPEASVVDILRQRLEERRAAMRGTESGVPTEG